MEFDNSARAVFNPGSATEFFDPAPAAAMAAVREFSATNAWWLAELSRLVYRNDSPGAARTRAQILGDVGLTESRFFQNRGTQCAIVETRGEAVVPIAVLVFRGTDGPGAWGINVKGALADWPQGGRVHTGFQRALDFVWREVDAALDKSAAPIFYTGHSLGGALAMLSASRRPPLATYAFGAPRVGDAGFAETLAGAAVYRLVNRRDSVTSLPPNLPGLRFRHAGELHSISTGSPSGRPGRRARFPPLPGRRRWFDPPANLCDHAPVNYVACLERIVAQRDRGQAD